MRKISDLGAPHVSAIQQQGFASKQAKVPASAQDSFNADGDSSLFKTITGITGHASAHATGRGDARLRQLLAQGLAQSVHERATCGDYNI